jgi:hypothetical protein
MRSVENLGSADRLIQQGQESHNGPATILVVTYNQARQSVTVLIGWEWPFAKEDRRCGWHGGDAAGGSRCS